MADPTTTHGTWAGAPSWTIGAPPPPGPMPTATAHIDLRATRLAVYTTRGTLYLETDGSVTMPEGSLGETAADWEAIGAAMVSANARAVRQQAWEMLDTLRQALEIPDITVYEAVTTLLTRLGRAKGMTGG